MAENSAWPKLEKVVKLPKLVRASSGNSTEDETSNNDKLNKNETEQNETVKLRGKKRFSQMAFKVIQQLYRDKIPAVTEEEEDIEIIELPQNKESTIKKHSKWDIAKPSRKTLNPSTLDIPKRSDSSLGNNKPKMRTPTPTRKKSTITSVMRLASLNKSINGKPKKNKNAKETASAAKEPEKDEEEADEVDLPNTPRFCSGLSEEAQFAMLKCYEDLILDGIGNDCRNVDECPPYLLRVSSPLQPIQAIHVEERPVSRKTKRRNVLKSIPARDNLNAPANSSSEDKGDESNGTISNQDEENSVLISADNKQLRLSYRFQTAMDMLDNIKLNQGRNITTPRDRMNKVKQLDNDSVYIKYNAWSKNWSKDFKYEFCN